MRWYSDDLEMMKVIAGVNMNYANNLYELAERNHDVLEMGLQLAIRDYWSGVMDKAIAAQKAIDRSILSKES
jgi:hypothetical protein